MLVCVVFIFLVLIEFAIVTSLIRRQEKAKATVIENMGILVLPIMFGSFIMVKDLVLLCGSIKQKKGALIAVAIMEAITILCLFVRFTITFNGFVDVDSIKFPDSIKIPLILFASYKLWNILVILGAIQQVKKKMINQRQEIATEMS